MTRLIDADALIYDEINEGVLAVFEYDIDNAPTVDAVPARHGKWITKSTGGEYFDCCSECGHIEWDGPSKYCPKCGARMDEDEIN